MARPRRRRRRDAALALAALVLALPFCLDLGRRRATRASGAPTDAVAVWDRGVYTPRRRPPPEPRAPALVRAWRRGRVDWHDVAGGYLRPGAAVLQIVPFGLRYRGDFEGIATRNGVSYGELVLEDRRRSVFHWEFLDPERLVAGRAAVLDAGSPPGGREVYAFWVNQDVVVPRAAFLGAVRGAAASPLNRRLLAG